MGGRGRTKGDPVVMEANGGIKDGLWGGCNVDQYRDGLKSGSQVW